MNSNPSRGAVLIGDRIVLRTPDPYFYQLAQRHPQSFLGSLIQMPTATSSCVMDGSPLILPMLLKMTPTRPHQGPKMYLQAQGSIVDFLFGSFVGLYIGYQSGYLQQGVKFHILEHIYYGSDGNFELGGTWRDWIRLLWDDGSTTLFMFTRTFSYAVAGGMTQTLMRMLYRWLCCSDGHVIPVVWTFVLMNIGEDNFFGSYRDLGNLAYYAAVFETAMMFGFKGNSTYFMRHFLERYILQPFRFVHSPKRWLSAMPYRPVF